MDCLTLLQTAYRAGLTVKRDGERLVVQGPRQAEALAQALLGRKDEVLSALSSPGESLGGNGPAAKLSGWRLFDLVHDVRTPDRVREACRAEILARADLIIAESEGCRPPPNPTVHAMLDEARTDARARQEASHDLR